MCTLATKITKDGSVIHGRTCEFESYYDAHMNFVPANHNSEVYFLNESEKEIIPNKYNYLYGSADAMIGNKHIASDAMNDQGLSVSVLYFHYHQYRELRPEEVTEKNLKWAHAARFLAGNYATVQEIKDAKSELEDIFYWPAGVPQASLGLHLSIVDKNGENIVVEPENEEFRIKENPTGILTNSSPLEYHYENLRQYSHLTPMIQKPTMKFGKLENHKLNTVGNSLLGMPGDFQANSRYVRAAIINSCAKVEENSEKGALQMFRILNTSDVIEGVIREELTHEEYDHMQKIFPGLLDIESEKEGVKTITSITDHTLVKDLSTLKFYWKSANNQSIRFVDLNDYINKGIDKILRINIWEDGSIKAQKVEMT